MRASGAERPRNRPESATYRGVRKRPFRFVERRRTARGRDDRGATRVNPTRMRRSQRIKVELEAAERVIRTSAAAGGIRSSLTRVVHRGERRDGLAGGLGAGDRRMESQGYLDGRRFLAAARTSLMLALPVSLRIVPSFALGENCGIGCGRFLFNVSPRFCWISPALGGVLSRWRLSSPGSFMVTSSLFHCCRPTQGCYNTIA